MIDKSQIQLLFEETNGIADTNYLVERGLSNYQLKQSVEKGWLVKLKQGLYKWAEYETEEIFEVAHIVPQGVFCLLTACSFYELTTHVPAQYQVAIPDERKVVLPPYPPIKLYYWNEVPFTVGITTVEISSGKIQMYDVEKTVCDVVRHQNKIGLDVVKEVVKSYLQRKNRNLNQLNTYAKTLNIQRSIHHYLDVLV